MSGYLRKMARRQMRANHAVFRRTVRDHEDLLQSIEGLFVTRARLTGLVDDAACHTAIESVLMGRPACSPTVADLMERLERVRQCRREVSEAAWRDALRVVAGSIRNHSQRLPGQVDYLTFVDSFIP